jgi:FkbM family methyltransferase
VTWFRRLLKTLRRGWRRPARFPQTIRLDDLGDQVRVQGPPPRFHVYSPVERYRIAEYGGERETLLRFLHTLQAGDVVYDVGASVGLFTITAARLIGPGVIYSFEPDSSTRARLEENVRLNHLENVHVVAWAVSDRDGQLTLFSDGASGFAPSMVRQVRPGAPKGETIVQTRSLDMALASGELRPPDVLKIDVEGAEALCLRGCQRLLRGEFGKPPRALFIELHPDLLPALDSSPQEVEELLEKLGYRLSWAQERAAQKHLCYELPSPAEEGA